MLDKELNDIDVGSIDKDIKDFNVFTQRVIKQIVSKDAEETKKLFIKYIKEKYPKENVKIDLYDEEIVKQIIELGIAEYIKKQNDLYETRILGKFNTDIDKDIEILESIIEEYENCSVPEIDMQVNVTFRERQANALSNVLNRLKALEEIINKKIKEVDYRIEKTMITERDLQFNLGKKCVLKEIVEEYRKEAEIEKFGKYLEREEKYDERKK